jgi:limonene-1,2-epoxide hydrolase
VWANGPFGHFEGRDAIRRSVERWTALATSADHEILTLAVSDNDVLMERIDSWVIDGRRWVTPVMGVMEIRDDEIAAWREYFHMPRGAT